MNDWVKGPTPLTGDTIDVFEGTVCVILLNGAVYAVRGPGRHGGFLRMLGERRLPIFGSLTTLTFERAPAVSRPVVTNVRLRDGATVTVTTQAAIVPLWESQRDAVRDVVQRYGVQPARIQEAAQLELEESIRVMARESLQNLTHNQVHGRADARTLMRPPAQKGLLTVGHLVSCSITRDQHEEAALATVRNGRLAQLSEVLEASLSRLRATHQIDVDTIRRRGELAGQMETAFSEAEINNVVAKLLGIPGVDVAYPEQREARLQAQYDTIRAVLADNMDLLPLLADPAYGAATAGLTNLISGVFPEPGHRGSGAQRGSARALAPAGSGVASGSGAQFQLLRRAVTPAPMGDFEVQLVDGSADRVIGAIGANGPHRLMIGSGPDPVDIALRALHGAATWCGVRVGARVLTRADGGSIGRVALTRVEPGSSPPHQDVEAALGGWVVAINTLLAGMAQISLDA